MGTSANYNLVIEQGSTFALQLVWKDENGNANDLTGYTARMQIRYRNYQGEIAVDASTDNGMITIENDTIYITINAITTASILPYNCVYDLELYNDDLVIKLLHGKVSILEGVIK